jgi:uncharacterized protein (TIGR03000 family)
MYSLVLMMAMSQGAATPAWQNGAADLRGTNFIHATANEHYRGRRGCGCCGGGYGCCGGGYGCCGGGWGGGYGCCGGGCGGSYGCCGGCWGGGYAMGGYGYGGYASYAMPYGYGSYAGMPAYGGYVSGYATPGTFGDTGTYGTGGTGAGSNPSGGGIPRIHGNGPGSPAGIPNAPAGGSDTRGPGENPKESLAPAPATLRVTLPADATLKVDGYTTRSTSGTRTFVTPPLEPGKVYHYTLTAELPGGSQPETVSKRVEVRPGAETNVTLAFPKNGVALK